MRQAKSRGSVAKQAENAPDNRDLEDQDSIEEILSRLPRNTPPEVREVVTQAIFSGPLPPPALLAHYEQTLPGLADRIATMAEKEQKVRHRDNAWILTNDSVKVSGSIVVSLVLIAAGVYCGIIGEPWLGGVLGTSGAIAGIMRQLLTRN